MSDDVDPRWSPPVGTPSDEVDPAWAPPAVDADDTIDPNWAPPEDQPSRTLPAGTPASDPFRSPLPLPLPTNSGTQQTKRVWLLGFVAGIVGIVVGVVITVSLVNRGGSNQAATPESTPTGARSPSSAPSQNNAPTAAPAPPAIPRPTVVTLNPSSYGYVTTRTKSGQTKCQISADRIICEAQYTSSPIMDGTRADGAVLTSDGGFEWSVGNLGNAPAVSLDYQTYAALGWTIVASKDGTRFTNDSTGHGMFVSIDSVNSF